MKKAITLIKQIDKLAQELCENYSIEEVNKAYEEFEEKYYPLGGSCYITRTIYIPD